MGLPSSTPTAEQSQTSESDSASQAQPVTCTPGASSSQPTDSSKALGIPQIKPLNPFQTITTRVQSTSAQLLQSNDAAARADYSRRLAANAAQFRALSSELAFYANTLVPISRLPREILLIIATLASFNDPPRPSRLVHAPRPDGRILEHIVNGSLGWITMIQVCHTWRITLQTAHCLWARNITALPRAIRAFRRYAGPTAPLTVDACLTRGLCVPSCEVTYDLIPLDRVRSMTWVLDKVEDITALHCKMSDPELPLPNLEHLTVDSSVGPDVKSLIYVGPNLLPKLRTLSTNMFYPSFTMPNLTQWYLSNLPISLDDIFDCMSASPLLSRIRLSNCQFTSAPITHRLQLPRLEFLHILDCTTTANESVFEIFQDHVDIPASTRFVLSPIGYIEEQDEDETSATEYDLFSAIRFCTRSLARAKPTPNILSIEEESLFLIHHDGPPDKDDPVWHDTCLLGALRLAEVAHGRDDLLENIFHDVATPASLEFDNITVLNIEFGPNVPWKKIYEALPNLQTLRICAQNQDALRILAVDLDDSDGQLYLPRLSLLWVDDAAYRAGSSQGECGDAIREPLLHVLRTRQEFCTRTAKPVALKEVYLQNFKDTSDDDTFLQALRALAPTVEWFSTECDEELVDKYLASDTSLYALC